MKPGKVEKYIHEKIDTQGALLLSLIDPDKQAGEEASRIAKISYDAGSDIILVGGSIGAQGNILDETVKLIKECVSIPVVLFPGNIGTITHHADAMYFMYMLNSRDVYWMSTAQIQGAPVVKRTKIEAIPTAYIVIEPGMAVGWIGNANLVPRSRPDLAAATAFAGELMGARLIVTDSGSGAPSPAPTKMISAIRDLIEVPYFYAGGVKTAEQAYEIIKAGADGIHVGTAFEIVDDVENKVKAMSEAIKKAGREKLNK
jgi:phosphoglycerol geranylgeranyltransferase